MYVLAYILSYARTWKRIGLKRKPTLLRNGSLLAVTDEMVCAMSPSSSSCESEKVKSALSS